IKPKTAAPTNNYIAGKTSPALKTTSDKALTPSVQAKAVPVSEPAPSKPASHGRLVFSLPVSTVAAETIGDESKPTDRGLPTETKRALEEVIAADVPTAVDAPSEVKPAAATEVVSKEVALPQIPIGATLTLNGKD